MCRLWIIVRLYTSKEQIKVEQFKSFCLPTYNLILNSFNNETSKWINISPTVHALLGHSWELIANNEGKGLGDYSEGGLEHNNKILRFCRRNLARKVTQETNMESCLTCPWLLSDPLIRVSGPSPPSCTHCQGTHFTVSCPRKASTVTPSSAQTLDASYIEELTF